MTNDLSPAAVLLLCYWQELIERDCSLCNVVPNFFGTPAQNVFFSWLQQFSPERSLPLPPAHLCALINDSVTVSELCWPQSLCLSLCQHLPFITGKRERECDSSDCHCDILVLGTVVRLPAYCFCQHHQLDYLFIGLGHLLAVFWPATDRYWLASGLQFTSVFVAHYTAAAGPLSAQVIKTSEWKVNETKRERVLI